MITSRKQFERNMHILSEKLSFGEVKFSEEMRKTVKGLLNIRISPNHRIDLRTIDEFARLTANSIVDMAQYRTDEKDTKVEEMS